MRKLIFLLLFTLSISSFVGCSKDDEMSQKELASKMAEYAEVLDEITRSEARILALQKEAESLTGEKWKAKQEEINREIQALRMLKDRRNKLKNELGIK